MQMSESGFSGFKDVQDILQYCQLITQLNFITKNE